MTRRALGAMTLAVLAAACGGDSTGSNAVTSVTVSGTATALIVGQTTQLTATARTQSGAVLASAPMTWSTSNSAVATVSPLRWHNSSSAVAAAVISASNMLTPRAAARSPSRRRRCLRRGR